MGVRIICRLKKKWFVTLFVDLSKKIYMCERKKWGGVGIICRFEEKDGMQHYL